LKIKITGAIIVMIFYFKNGESFYEKT